MTSTLRTLLDRVEQGEGADFELDCRLAWTFGLEPWAGRPEDHVGLCMPRSKIAQATPALTSSIDAAVTLVEKVLPGWVWTMAHWWCEGDSKPPFYADLCELEKAKADDDTAIIARAWSSSPARALVAALLRAKIAQEEGA